MTTKTLSALVQSFFTIALPQRGMSPLTILSYRSFHNLGDTSAPKKGPDQ
jgi:hypothetical protein